jgi:multiple sugar transport system permease protein
MRTEKTPVGSGQPSLAAGFKGRAVRLIGDVRKSAASYALMAPFLILFIVFTLVPVFSAIFLSFTSFNSLQAPRWVGWANYIRLLLDDQIFLLVLKNTLAFAFLTGPISYLICFFLAWFINDFKPWLRAVLTLVFYAPSLAGNIFFIWSAIFSGDYYGIFNGILVSLGIIKDPINWLQDPKYILGVVIVVQLWLSLGASFLAFIAGFQTIDKSLYEAGVIDGIRNRWQELWYITIPSMAPQLLFGAVMQIGASFGVSQVIMALGGFPTRGYAADSVTTYIIDYGTVRMELGYASAIAVVLFITMLLTNKVISSALKRYMD